MNRVLDNHIQDLHNISSHNIICTHPLYRGKLYTRLRAKDLKSLSLGSKGVQSSIAAAELSRRGYIDSRLEGTKFLVEISLHAIDRLSMYHMHRFLSQYDGERGISSWCNKLVKEAFNRYSSEQLEHLAELESFKLQQEGMVFLIRPHEYRDNVFVLTTIEP